MGFTLHATAYAYDASAREALTRHIMRPPLPQGKSAPCGWFRQRDVTRVEVCLKCKRMKNLHRTDMYGWSQFDTSRNMDFNSVLWVTSNGNVAIDPLPLTEHDSRHLEQLGSVQHIIVTNSDHIRDTVRLRERTGAMIYAPAAEQDTFTTPVDQFLKAGQEPLPGLVVYEMNGSKTPGELALLIDATTLVTGDLIRAHSGGQLDILPESKLTDAKAAVDSIRKLSQLDGIIAVLTGDGWPVFRDGSARLRELAARLDPARESSE